MGDGKSAGAVANYWIGYRGRRVHFRMKGQCPGPMGARHAWGLGQDGQKAHDEREETWCTLRQVFLPLPNLAKDKIKPGFCLFMCVGLLCAGSLGFAFFNVWLFSFFPLRMAYTRSVLSEKKPTPKPPAAGSRAAVWTLLVCLSCLCRHGPFFGSWETSIFPPNPATPCSPHYRPGLSFKVLPKSPINSRGRQGGCGI